MNINFKMILMLIPFMVLISCSRSEESNIAISQTETVAWDATNAVLYNEFMQCTAGEDYSKEALNEMVSSWRGLELSESLLGGWGYTTVTSDNTSFNNWWELSWSSKEAADAGWQEWLTNEEGIAWSEKYSTVLQCNGESRDGYDFIFPHDPYAFGDSPDDGSFAASFSPCTLNDGMSQDDFSAALIEFNAWLDGLDESQVNGFYAYGIYIPDAAEEEDFWFANFYETLETMSEGNALWEETGGDAKLKLEAVSTCNAPEISNGQVFFDPTDPNFS